MFDDTLNQHLVPKYMFYEKDGGRKKKKETKPGETLNWENQKRG